MDNLGLFSHEHGRSRGDIIEVCKILKSIDSQNPIPRATEFRTRGHKLKMRWEKFKRDLMGLVIQKW